MIPSAILQTLFFFLILPIKIYHRYIRRSKTYEKEDIIIISLINTGFNFLLYYFLVSFFRVDIAAVGICFLLAFIGFFNGLKYLSSFETADKENDRIDKKKIILIAIAILCICTIIPTGTYLVCSATNEWHYNTLSWSGTLYKKQYRTGKEVSIARGVESYLLDGEWIYFINKSAGNLCKVKSDGTEEQIISDDTVSKMRNVADDWITYELDNGDIYKIKSNGTERQRE